MKVLVTGAAGFVGSHLVDRLVADGHRVTGVDDLSTGTLANLAAARRTKGLGFHRFDVTSGDLAALVARDRPDAVCHLAAATGADALTAARTDVLGTVGVLEACARAGVPRCVLASTGEVYGEPAALPVSERAALHPGSPAAAGKAAAEGYLEAYGRDGGPAWVALRLGTVYGPRDAAGLVGGFVRALVTGRPGTVPGDGTSTRDLVHVDDVVDAFLRCLGGRADGRRLNVGSGTGTPVRALHALVARAAGAADAPDFGPAPAAPPGPVLDGGAARRALGWEPAVGLEEGLARTVAAARER